MMALSRFLLLALLILPAGVARADSGALWRIVNGRCVPDQQDHANPAPCEAVALDGGWAALKDIVGTTQFLLIPTARLAAMRWGKS